MSTQTPAGWYPDAQNNQIARWWDGQQWTQHTQPARQSDDADRFELAITGDDRPDAVRNQVGKVSAATPQQGGGTLFTEPVLVVNQKAKLVEMANEYAIHDQQGNKLGSVMQVGQSGFQKAMRLLSKMDSIMTVKLEIRDAAGVPVLRITRPATLWKSQVTVERADGTEVGTMKQEKIIGKARFSLYSGGQKIGEITGKNLVGWNFHITDQQGQQVAEISKTFSALKEMFSTADNYVVQIHQELPEPMASMVVASAVTVDTVLKQDAK